MADILLVTHNARFHHTALGLRYLKANLGKWRPHCEIIESDISQRSSDLLEQILVHDPKVVGIGIHIWNAVQGHDLVRLLKRVRPDLPVVIGGPEVSHGVTDGTITSRTIEAADHVIQGEGEVAFKTVVDTLLTGDKESPPPPLKKIITAPLPDLNRLKTPYSLYSDADIAHRTLYLENARGCPYRCAFCLSALDKKVRPFPMQRLLDDLQHLMDRGARQFKFVDRTFNLSLKRAGQLLDFFLERMTRDLFLHFELVPDRLPEALKSRIRQFPAGTLQFEIGIQSLNVEVQARMGRRQNSQRSMENLRWLMQESTAHLHTDLIIGLPGETCDEIAQGFDALIALNPHEIQVGILKRLHGTPLLEQIEPFQLTFNPAPPYDLLLSSTIDFQTMQRYKRFARFWDLIGNSGIFTHTRNLITREGSPFVRFLALSDWLYAETGTTHRIARARLFRLLAKGIPLAVGIPSEQVTQTLLEDFQKVHPGSSFMETDKRKKQSRNRESRNHHNNRQKRFQQSEQ